MRLRPHCNHHTVKGILCVVKEDGDISAVDHLGASDRSRGGDVVKINAEASYELHRGQECAEVPQSITLFRPLHFCPGFFKISVI